MPLCLPESGINRIVRVNSDADNYFFFPPFLRDEIIRSVATIMTINFHNNVPSDASAIKPIFVIVLPKIKKSNIIPTNNAIF